MGRKYYQYKVLAYGMAIATAVFTTYYGVHLEIAKTRFLRKLVPQSVKVPKARRDLTPKVKKFEGPQAKVTKYYAAVSSDGKLSALELIDMVETLTEDEELRSHSLVSVKE